MTSKKKAIPRAVHFETTIPVVRQCARCAVWLAAGVAEGMKAEIEFVPLDPGQALWAVLNRIELYEMRRVGLVHMDSMRLSGPRRGKLYPQHRCDIRWPAPAGRPFRNPRESTIPPY